MSFILDNFKNEIRDTIESLGNEDQGSRILDDNLDYLVIDSFGVLIYSDYQETRKE
jgi:hypothetical protein